MVRAVLGWRAHRLLKLHSSAFGSLRCASAAAAASSSRARRRAPPRRIISGWPGDTPRSLPLAGPAHGPAWLFSNYYFGGAPPKNFPLLLFLKNSTKRNLNSSRFRSCLGDTKKE